MGDDEAKRRFIDAHLHRTLGLVVDGIIHTRPSDDARLRLLCRLPLVVETLLAELYDTARKDLTCPQCKCLITRKDGKALTARSPGES